MCSVGHVKPWHGDVHKTAALTEALEARSHKKEVIVAVFTPAALPQLLTWIDQVEALGLGHILALALDAQVRRTLAHGAWRSTRLPARPAVCQRIMALEVWRRAWLQAGVVLLLGRLGAPE